MKKLARNFSILLIALLLACCLVAGLAACGGDEPTEGGTPEGSEENESGTSSAKSYEFEAEYTDIMSSVNAGSIFIGPDTTKDMGVAVLAAEDCSNGYCVGNMNQKGDYIFFEIESDAEVETEIIMSVSMNYENKGTAGTVVLTDEEFEVLVNTETDSERQQYGSITYDMNGLTQDYTHNAFKEYSVGKVTLKKGTNTIILKTNNATHSQVANLPATAPLVDYLRLETTATLSWTPDTSVVEGTSGMSLGATTLVK